MKNFIDDLLRDIAAHKSAAPALTRWPGTDLPCEALLGTFWMRSEKGTLLEFYNWIDPDYCYEPLYEREELHLTSITFHTLARYDTAYLKQRDDFMLYGMRNLERIVASLRQAGFTLLVTS